MRSPKEIHEEGIDVVVNRLNKIGISAERSFKQKEDADIIAKANMRTMRIKVKASDCNNDRYKFPLGEYPVPDESLYYVFVCLVNRVNPTEIFPFTSQYVADHPYPYKSKLTKKSKSKWELFYFYADNTKSGPPNMRLDYENSRNNDGIFLNYFGIKK